MKKLNTLFLFVLCTAFATSMQAQLNQMDKQAAKSTLTKAKETYQGETVPSTTSALPDGAVVLWGGPGDPNGEFDGGLNDWTTNGTDGNGADTPWTWEDDADVTEGAFSPDDPIASPSAANGAVAFNSDFYDNGGDGMNLGGGPNPAPHNSNLTSPIIDMTGHTNIALNFFSFYRRFDSNPTVQWSNNGGANWSDPIIVHDEVENPVNVAATNREVLIYLPGAGGTDQFQFRFTFAGGDQSYYFWMVDDVAIIEQPQNDLAINTIFYTPGAYAQPESQVDQDTFAFFMYVTNAGSVDQTNVTMTARVLDATDAIVFETEQVYPEIASGVTDSTFDIAGSFVPDMLPQGSYRLEYAIESDSTDQWTFDNVASENFEITEGIYATEDGDNPFESYFTPAGSPPWQIANIYQTGDDFGTIQYEAINIQSRGTTNQDDPISGKSINVFLLEVSDDINEGFGNLEDMNYISNPDLTIVGFGNFVYTDEEGEDIITVPLEKFSGDGPVLLNPGKRYLALVDYTNANTIFHAFNTKIDYRDDRLNFLAFNENTQNWFGGFADGSNLLAFVRLEIQEYIVSTDEQSLPASVLSLFPNPTSDLLNVSIDMETTGRARLLVADMSGRIIETQDFDGLYNNNVQVDVADYPAGMYFLRLATEEGMRTVKFNVQK